MIIVAALAEPGIIQVLGRRTCVIAQHVVSQDCLFGGRSLNGLKRRIGLDGWRLENWHPRHYTVAEAARCPSLSL